jgi:hypothetical protein
MSTSHPPRIQAFREAIIKVLPRVPHDRASLDELRAGSTQRLVTAYVTWQMRFIPQKPRLVRCWSGGVSDPQVALADPRIRHLLEDVAAGKDLTGYLSQDIHTKGIVLPGAKAEDARKDIDRVLTRQGLHHFHLGARTADNPKGRSGILVFAEVLEDEFRIVAISNHEAFEPGSDEYRRFFSVCAAYIEKDVPPGQGYMSEPVMSSGHSMIVTMFAEACVRKMHATDPQLDDPDFVDKLYDGQEIVRAGQTVPKPAKPSLEWHFQDLVLGILDRKSKVFFQALPFFSR